MNWTAIAFDWNQVRAFLATVEEGSLSAAARVLKQTQPTLGRQVAALEDALGVVLFERIGKSLVLTEAGLQLLDHVRDMADAAGRISLTATGQSQDIAGRVRITASDTTAAWILPPILKDLRKRAPGIAVDVIASNKLRDLQRREADIAVRHVRPEQPDLIARLVREDEGHFYAAPAYLDRQGRPETIDAFMDNTFIGFETADTMVPYLVALGLPFRPEHFHYVSDSGIAVWEMVRQGLGIGVMGARTAALFPEVERIALPDLPVIPIPMWLATHRELTTSRRIRVVFDLLAEALAR